MHQTATHPIPSLLSGAHRYHTKSRDKPSGRHHLHNISSQPEEWEKDETITLSHMTDPIMCPVCQGACIVNHILAIPGQTADSTINTYQSGNHIKTLNSETAIKRVRKLATELGHYQIGHDPLDIGLCSICSAAAMAMILAGVPNYMVMLIGCWKSDVFLI